MYTNQKPHQLPDYAQGPLLSRSRRVLAASLVVCGFISGMIGAFHAPSDPLSVAQAGVATPAPEATTAGADGADARVVCVPAAGVPCDAQRLAIPDAKPLPRRDFAALGH